MRSKVIGIIFKKQLIELLRDKRTVFVIFILPILLYPIMIVGITQLSVFMIGKMQKEVYQVYVENPGGAPGLIGSIEADTQFVISVYESPDSALQEGELELIVRIPASFEENIGVGMSESLTVEYNAAEERSDMAGDRLANIISDYEKGIVTERVTSAGLDSTITQPVLQNFRNVATEKKMGGFVFGRILAMILVIMVITGAYYPSIDMVAGEKERGTLETLLVSPVGRMEIVVGKYFTVLVLALLNAMLNLASLGLTLGLGMKFLGGPLAENISLSITPGMLFMILAELLPLAALFSAIFLTVSSYARSYKEAQGYLTPVFMLAYLPAMAAIIPGLELSIGAAFVPVLNVALLFRKMMVGSVDPLIVLIVWGSTALYAALALKWASSILSNEEVLLSETKESPLSGLFKKRKSTGRRHAGISDAIILYAVCITLLWWLGVPAQANNLVIGLIVTEVLLVALPPYILARRLKFNLKETFRLGAINLPRTLLMIPIAAAGFFLIIQLEVIFSRTGLPPEYIEQFESMFKEFSSLGPLGGLAVIALLPAICEELLFRGYILDGLTRKLSPTMGILLSGLLFGAFHMDPYRLVPATILGIIFGSVVWRGGSIFYGMLGHFFNNGIAFAVGLWGGESLSRFISEDHFAPLWLIIVAIVIFGISIWAFWKMGNRKQKPILSYNVD